MSGRHFNEAGFRIATALHEIAGDHEVQTRFPTLAGVLAELGGVLRETVYVLDLDLSGDGGRLGQPFEEQALIALLILILRAAPDRLFPRGKWATILSDSSPGRPRGDPKGEMMDAHDGGKAIQMMDSQACPDREIITLPFDETAGSGPFLKSAERAYIERMLALSSNIADAAQRIGISRASLYRKFKELAIEDRPPRMFSHRWVRASLQQYPWLATAICATCAHPLHVPGHQDAWVRNVPERFTQPVSAFHSDCVKSITSEERGEPHEVPPARAVAVG